MVKGHRWKNICIFGDSYHLSSCHLMQALKVGIKFGYYLRKYIEVNSLIDIIIINTAAYGFANPVKTGELVWAFYPKEPQVLMSLCLGLTFLRKCACMMHINQLPFLFFPTRSYLVVIDEASYKCKIPLGNFFVLFCVYKSMCTCVSSQIYHASLHIFFLLLCYTLVNSSIICPSMLSIWNSKDLEIPNEISQLNTSTFQIIKANLIPSQRKGQSFLEHHQRIQNLHQPSPQVHLLCNPLWQSVVA